MCVIYWFHKNDPYWFQAYFGVISHNFQAFYMDILDISGVFFFGGGECSLWPSGQDDTPQQQMAGSQFTSPVHMCHGQSVAFFGGWE